MSSPGASVTGSRIPTTVKRRCPSTTWTAAGPGDAEPAGGRRSQDDGEVAARRGVEEDAVGERGADRRRQRRSAARVVSPFVSVLGMSSERKTGRRPAPVAETASTGPIRPTIAHAVGSGASSPKIDCPGETVSRFVPSRSSDDRRSALLDSEIARTATIAAMPIAIPRPDSAARSARREADGPDAEDVAAGARPSVRLHHAAAFVSSSTSPSRSSTRRGSDSASSLVRDHDDGRARAVQLAQERDDTLAGEVSRFPVGSSAKRIRAADDAARDGDRWRSPPTAGSAGGRGGAKADLASVSSRGASLPSGRPV